jgi:hypothetical protein
MVVNCPDNGRCDVRCEAFDYACTNLDVNCGGDVCDVSCAASENICLGMTLNCGADDSEVTCAAATTLSVESAGSSCACKATGCD